MIAELAVLIKSYVYRNFVSDGLSHLGMGKLGCRCG